MCVCVFVPVSIDYVCFEAATFLFCSCSILFEKLFSGFSMQHKMKNYSSTFATAVLSIVFTVTVAKFFAIAVGVQQLVHFNIVRLLLGIVAPVDLIIDFYFELYSF